MSKSSSVGDLRASKSADPLPLILTNKLQEGILLKVSQASDTSLSQKKSPLHKQRSQDDDQTKNYLRLPGEDDRSNRRHSVQVSGSRRSSKSHDRKGSYPETELLRPKDSHLLKPYGHHSISPSPEGSVVDCSRRRSSSRDSRDFNSPSRRSSNSSGGHSRRSSRTENGESSRHHHHHSHHHGSSAYHSGHHSRRESSISTCGEKRSRVNSTASCSGRIVDLKRNSCVNSFSTGSRKGEEFDDDLDSVTRRRRKIIIMIIGSAFIFILLTSVLLVAVTLTLSPKIDELVRKENEESHFMIKPHTTPRPLESFNRTMMTTTSSGHPDG